MSYKGLLDDCGLKKVPNGWRIHLLDEMCSGIIDCPHSTPKLVDKSNYYVVKTQDVRSGHFEPLAADCVSESTYLQRIKRAEPESGDILLSREGTYFGDAAEVPTNTRVCLGQRMVLIRSQKGIVDPTFLRLFINSKGFQKYLFRFHEGTVAQRINVSEIRKLPILLPPMDTQKYITSKILPIENKARINTQTNQTLEEMAQAIFKSWFVDFDPVKAKMNGDQPEGMDDATALLFPEKLVESELGLIPEGWDAGKLSDVAKYCSARTNTDTISLENYISTENMLAEKKGVAVASKLPTAKTVAAYKSGDILVSNIRPYFKKIWLAEGNGGRSNDVLGFESISPNTDSYLMNLLYQDTFFEYMTRTSKGAKMPRGDKTAIMNWEMAVAPVELREAFSAIVDKFYKLIPENRAQNTTLESLRETLIPKLLSGEIELDQTLEK